MCCKEFIGAFYSNKHVIPVMIGEVPNLEECKYNLKDEISRLQRLKYDLSVVDPFGQLLRGIRTALSGK